MADVKVIAAEYHEGYAQRLKLARGRLWEAREKQRVQGGEIEKRIKALGGIVELLIAGGGFEKRLEKRYEETVWGPIEKEKETLKVSLAELNKGVEALEEEITCLKRGEDILKRYAE